METAEVCILLSIARNARFARLGIHCLKAWWKIATSRKRFAKNHAKNAMNLSLTIDRMLLVNQCEPKAIILILWIEVISNTHCLNLV